MHATLLQTKQSPIGNRHSMGVPRQIAEHLFWSAEWGFGVDHPFLIFQGRDQPLKANPAGQFAKLSIEPQAPFRKRLPEIGEELSAEQVAERFHRQKEILFPGRDPSLFVWCQSSSGHDAMHVGMDLQSLSPGVQDGQEAQFGSQTFGIGGHFQKSLCYGPEQNPIDDLRILQSQRRQFVWQSEHHMAIGNGQNFLRPLGKPLVARPAVALWAMPVTARTVFNHLMGAVIALLYVGAEGGRAARADIPESLPLLGRQYRSPAIQEFLTMLAEDIGDFTSRFRPLLRPSAEYSTDCSGSASKGLGAACSRFRDTRRYLAVVRISAWPRRTWMVRRSAPASSICVAQAWRNRCGWTRCWMPARPPAVRHSARMELSSSG